MRGGFGFVAASHGEDVKMGGHSATKFYIIKFLQRISARSMLFLFERATGINYTHIESFGFDVDTSFEVIFQNQDIVAFLKAIYTKNIFQDSHFDSSCFLGFQGPWLCMWVGDI